MCYRPEVTYWIVLPNPSPFSPLILPLGGMLMNHEAVTFEASKTGACLSLISLFEKQQREIASEKFAATFFRKTFLGTVCLQF